MNVQNIDGIHLLKLIDNNKIDLILTDPPYIISKTSGMNKFDSKVKELEKTKKNAKTEEEWNAY